MGTIANLRTAVELIGRAAGTKNVTVEVVGWEDWNHLRTLVQDDPDFHNGSAEIEVDGSTCAVAIGGVRFVHRREPRR